MSKKVQTTPIRKYGNQFTSYVAELFAMYAVEDFKAPHKKNWHSGMSDNWNLN
jgi:hypothetical protein